MAILGASSGLTTPVFLVLGSLPFPPLTPDGEIKFGTTEDITPLHLFSGLVLVLITQRSENGMNASHCPRRRERRAVAVPGRRGSRSAPGLSRSRSRSRSRLLKERRKWPQQLHQCQRSWFQCIPTRLSFLLWVFNIITVPNPRARKGINSGWWQSQWCCLLTFAPIVQAEAHVCSPSPTGSPRESGRPHLSFNGKKAAPPVCEGRWCFLILLSVPLPQPSHSTFLLLPPPPPLSHFLPQPLLLELCHHRTQTCFKVPFSEAEGLIQEQAAKALSSLF